MIELEDVPELIDPVMVAAFEGWNDAGDAASAAIGHLEREWKGEVFAALDAEDYYDFQVNRPQMWLDDGVRKITWPTTRLAVVRIEDADGKGSPRDLVLVRGIEPSMRWRSFCNEILAFAHELGVEMVVVLGALLGDAPHTRPVPVTGVTSDTDLARTMNLEESRYEGPTGIVGILQEACTHAGVPAVSLWASVPHYVSQPPNPKATLGLLNSLEDLLGLRIPLGDLSEDARAWQVGVDQLAAEDSEVAEYVQSLEEARDTAELPEASGEAIAKEFERYLRRRDGGPGPGPDSGQGGAGSGGTAPGSYLRDTGGRTRPSKRRGGQDGETGAAPEEPATEQSEHPEQTGQAQPSDQIQQSEQPGGGESGKDAAGEGSERADGKTDEKTEGKAEGKAKRPKGTESSGKSRKPREPRKSRKPRGGGESGGSGEAGPPPDPPDSKEPGESEGSGDSGNENE